MPPTTPVTGLLKSIVVADISPAFRHGAPWRSQRICFADSTGTRRTSQFQCASKSYNRRSFATSLRPRQESAESKSKESAKDHRAKGTHNPSTHRAEEHTHYTFFPKSIPKGAPPGGPFAIDLNALKREFLQLQAQAHPDMHGHINKKKAEALSARINEAYKTLQDPLKRAQYLLSLRGIDVAEDERLKVEDPELLMTVLETREEIEAAQTEDEIDAMREINEQRVEESVGILTNAFEEGDIEGAKNEAVKLRYWINIRESLHAWEKGKPVVLIH